MDIEKYNKLMEKALLHLEKEFSMLQVGRASSGLVENINVFIPDWGMSQKMSQMANITVIDAHTIKVEPWDKTSISHIEKGIYDSEMGLSPMNQGDYLYIKIPALTEERRKELVKMVNKMGEDAKISIRNARHDAIKEIKRLFDEKELSEDEKKNYEVDIDKTIKLYNGKVDIICKNKGEEVMKV